MEFDSRSKELQFCCLFVDSSSQHGLNLDTGSKHQIEIVVEEERTQLGCQEQRDRQTDSLPQRSREILGVRYYQTEAICHLSSKKWPSQAPLNLIAGGWRIH